VDVYVGGVEMEDNLWVDVASWTQIWRCSVACWSVSLWCCDRLTATEHQGCARYKKLKLIRGKARHASPASVAWPRGSRLSGAAFDL
jgi:hypothetical protein